MEFESVTMDVDRQYVHLSISSRLTREMLGSTLINCKDCKGSFVVIDNPANNRLNGKSVITIHDWRDLMQRRTSQPHPAEHEAASTVPNTHIIVNMIKGEEGQIPGSLDFRKIRGLFYIDDSLETFTRGLNSILAGDIWVPRMILVNWMVCPVADNGISVKNNVLSSRQESILKYIALGMSNTDIAKELEISSNTVKAHLYAIFKLINVSNRIQAAQWADNYLYDNTSTSRN